MRRATWMVALGLTIGLAGALQATQILFTDFEGFKIGASIENQNGWSSDNPTWDEEVVNVGGNTVWRVSNAVVSGSFGDMPFATRLGGVPVNTVTNPTNDSPGAFAGESSTGTTLKLFRAAFSFRSATGTPQPGARITVSADNGEGARQSFIAVEDTGTGIKVETFDVDSAGNFIGPIVIASGLSYKKWHTTAVEIRFKDGLDNDVVKYFINGKRVHTGPSWEQFYRNFQAALHPLGVPVQTLLFRLSGTPCVPCLGGGYYIDNLGLSVSGFGDGEHHHDCDDDDGDDDGHDNDHDLDDDNDGHSDAVDLDDDNDGIEDAFDGSLTNEEQSSHVADLQSGEETQYVLSADADTITVTAVLADGQAVGMDILNPLGLVVAQSVPSIGRAILTVPAAAGNYVVRVRNIGATDVASRVTLIQSSRR